MTLHVPYSSRLVRYTRSQVVCYRQLRSIGVSPATARAIALAYV